MSHCQTVPPPAVPTSIVISRDTVRFADWDQEKVGATVLDQYGQELSGPQTSWEVFGGDGLVEIARTHSGGRSVTIASVTWPVGGAWTKLVASAGQLADTSDVFVPGRLFRTDQRWSAHFFPAKPDVGEVLSTAAGGWFESQVGLPVEYEFVLDDSTVARTVALD